MGTDFLLQVYVQMERLDYILKDLKKNHYYFVYDCCLHIIYRILFERCDWTIRELCAQDEDVRFMYQELREEPEVSAGPVRGGIPH